MEIKQVLVKDLYRNTDSYINNTVKISGWVKTLRDSKTFGFIELNDGSFFKNIQVVFDNILYSLQIFYFFLKSKECF